MAANHVGDQVFKAPEARTGVTLQREADRVIQGTNDDASMSKMSCVQLGYFDDEFLKLFVRRRRCRRSPLINRGYFARVQAIRQLLQAFLRNVTNPEGVCEGQVISLGAGWDTQFFRLATTSRAPKKYVEVDHMEVASSKCRSIESHQELMQVINDTDKDAKIDVKGGTIISDKYCLIPSDLRDINQLAANLDKARLDPQAPTFVLMECVMAYLEGEATKKLLRWITHKFDTCALVIYDMVGPNDPFGQQLVLNVQSRGCPLPGIRSFPSVESHLNLMWQGGFDASGTSSMREVYEKYIEAKERERVERIEPLDEFEEWNLIMSHYCISYGVKGNTSLLADSGLPLPYSLT